MFSLEVIKYRNETEVIHFCQINNQPYVPILQEKYPNLDFPIIEDPKGWKQTGKSWPITKISEATWLHYFVAEFPGYGFAIKDGKVRLYEKEET